MSNIDGMCESFVPDCANDLYEVFERCNSTPEIFYKKISEPLQYGVLSIYADHPGDNSCTLLSPDHFFSGDLNRILRSSSNCFLRADSFVLIYIIDGSCEPTIEDRKIHLKKGDACMVKRDALYSYDMHSSCVILAINMTWEFFSIFPSHSSRLLFKEENALLPSSYLYRFIFSGLPESNHSTDISRKGDAAGHKKHRKNSDAAIVLTKKSSIPDRIREMLDDSFEESLRNTLFPSGIASFRIMELCLRACCIFSNTEYYDSYTVGFPKYSESTLFERVYKLLEESRGCISCSEISDLLCYNSCYLNYIVKSQSGISINDHRTIFRMRAAADMLENTRMTIAEITAELRFTNRTHFYKLFEVYYQCTPGEYRRKLKRQKNAPDVRARHN